MEGQGFRGRRIIILPIYNESATLDEVIRKLESFADLMILVDDGSTDESLKIASERAAKNQNISLIGLEKNYGKSRALKKGFEMILEMQKEGKIEKDDLVIITDADGQLPPEIMNDATDYFIEKRLGMLIGLRNFSIYPLIKKVGNYFLSFIASLLTGYRFRDTQCGFRMFTVEILARILPFYRAVGYSCEQEMSIIGAMIGEAIDNNFVIEPCHYRSNSTFKDAIQITLDSFATYFRVRSAGFPYGLKTRTAGGKR
jgi:cellulose synthase/poly-beta-1,6-N-acetylglucosamine synthase-like glycosyltransferase